MFNNNINKIDKLIKLIKNLYFILVTNIIHSNSRKNVRHYNKAKNGQNKQIESGTR